MFFSKGELCVTKFNKGIRYNWNIDFLIANLNALFHCYCRHLKGYIFNVSFGFCLTKFLKWAKNPNTCEGL